MGSDHYYGIFASRQHPFFESDLNLVDWLSQFGEGNEVYFKSFLGRMLFSGEEVMKKSTCFREERRCVV